MRIGDVNCEAVRTHPLILSFGQWVDPLANRSEQMGIIGQ